jgi:hypothetical protein
MRAAARHETTLAQREPIAIHLASLASRGAELAEAIRRLPTEGDPVAEASQHLAVGMLVEPTDEARAREAYRSARIAWPAHESALRALADIDDTLNVPRELAALAHALPESPRRAHLLLEALSRASALDDATREEWTRRAHDADPSSGIAAHLGERGARARGDVDGVLQWIGERRAITTEGVESALDDVRVALLTADRDTRGAMDRLASAHAVRPSDVALRELYERLATEPLDDAGAWRIDRATAASGLARRALGTEATLELELSGDLSAALDTFASFPSTLAGYAAERIHDARGGEPSEIARLEAQASDDGEGAQRVEALSRLASLHERGGRAAEALECHRRALSEDAHSLPSLRHCEHDSITSGDRAARATASTQVAIALGSANDGELSAHAAMAARLRAHELGWEAGRLPADLAFRMSPPPIWAARLHGAHARFSKDDAALLATSEFLLAQTPPPRRADVSAPPRR